MIQITCRMEAGWRVASTVSRSSGSCFWGRGGGRDASRGCRPFWGERCQRQPLAQAETQSGRSKPEALGGDRRSDRIEAHDEAVMVALGLGRDATIEEVTEPALTLIDTPCPTISSRRMP